MKSEKIILDYKRRCERQLAEKQKFKKIPKSVEGSSGGLYVLYKNKSIVYIGKSLSGLRNRIIRHTKDHLKINWDSYSWFIMRKKHISELEALLVKIHWRARYIRYNSQSPKFKMKKIQQKKNKT